MKAKAKVKTKGKKLDKKAKKLKRAKKLQAQDELRKLVVSTHSLFAPTPHKQAARAGIIFF